MIDSGSVFPLATAPPEIVWVCAEPAAVKPVRVAAETPDVDEVNSLVALLEVASLSVPGPWVWADSLAAVGSVKVCECVAEPACVSPVAVAPSRKRPAPHAAHVP